MADGRDIHSRGRDSGRTLDPDGMNIFNSETANRYQESRRRGITGRRSVRTAAIRFRDNPNRKTEFASRNQLTEPVSQDSKRSNLPLDVLPIKKRYRPDEGRMSVENANQNPGEKQMPGPGSRRLPPEAYCFHKNLSSSAVSLRDGKLDLTHQEASTIPSCPQMTEDTRDSFRKSALIVFDGQDTQWRMVLTGYNYENQIFYTLAGDWRRFVSAHGLRHGDSICFYKNLDPRVAADYYYVILFRRRAVHTRTAVR